VKIAIGSDHVGYPLKQAVAAFLQAQEAEVVDVGPATPENPVDYPDYAFAVDRLGLWRLAARYPGLRHRPGHVDSRQQVPWMRRLCDDAFLACSSRAHNDANVLCLGVTT
jgi:ribose 5-phosphate isomerase B